MKKFEEKTFTIPPLKGMSVKSIEAHLKLYSGYVKNANTILEKIEEYRLDSEKNAYALGELQRRFSFEFDGMRNHEYYFDSLSGVATPLTQGPLMNAIDEDFGSFENFMNMFKAIALTRGVGWTVLYYDNYTKRLLTQWVDEQHLGHLTGLSWVLGIDLWEHAFVLDYPTGKKEYIEDFFANLNWSVIESNFANATR